MNSKRCIISQVIVGKRGKLWCLVIWLETMISSNWPKMSANLKSRCTRNKSQLQFYFILVFFRLKIQWPVMTAFVGFLLQLQTDLYARWSFSNSIIYMELNLAFWKILLTTIDFAINAWLLNESERPAEYNDLVPQTVNVVTFRLLCWLFKCKVIFIQ